MGISSCNKLLGDRWIFLMKRFLKRAAGGAFSPQEQFADGESLSGCTIAACYFCVTTPWLISDGKPLIILLDLSLSLHVKDRGSKTVLVVPLLVSWRKTCYAQQIHRVLFAQLLYACQGSIQQRIVLSQDLSLIFLSASILRFQDEILPFYNWTVCPLEGHAGCEFQTRAFFICVLHYVPGHHGVPSSQGGGIQLKNGGDFHPIRNRHKRVHDFLLWCSQAATQRFIVSVQLKQGDMRWVSSEGRTSKNSSADK